ncbi:DUF732 domain-containing protein [Dietzia sp.]|uniref:DUF732 domain-containing protein n=1 Tax=Dietzia sp. TaxID=1871616 RepID=UPI002FD9A2AB
MIDGRGQNMVDAYGEGAAPGSATAIGAGPLRRRRAGRRLAALALATGAACTIAGCSQIKVADSSSSSTSTASSFTSSGTSAAAPSSAPPAAPPSSPAPAPSPAPGEPGAPAPAPAPGDPAAPAPAAPAAVDPQQRDNFLVLTDQLGASMPEGVDAGGVITEACAQLGGGTPLQDVLGFVGEKGGYDTEKSSFFLAGGVPVYCPDNTPKLTG